LDKGNYTATSLNLSPTAYRSHSPRSVLGDQELLDFDIKNIPKELQEDRELKKMFGK